jgi:hypothetical protein
MDKLNTRVQAVEEYIKSLITAEMDQYVKGEWLGLVRSKLRDIA